MYLLGHNAHLTTITSAPVVADPALGIPGSAGTVRWTGSCEAYIDQDIVDEVKMGMIERVAQTIIDLPVNLPTWPDEEDRLTFTRSQVLYPSSAAQPQTETLIVRKIDGGLVFLGKLRVYVVRS